MTEPSTPEGCECCRIPIDPDEETFTVIVREIDFYERSDGELEVVICEDCMNRSDDDIIRPKYGRGHVEWSVLEDA